MIESDEEQQKTNEREAGKDQPILFLPGAGFVEQFRHCGSVRLHVKKVNRSADLLLRLELLKPAE
jgi:hypothetical protein